VFYFTVTTSKNVSKMFYAETYFAKMFLQMLCKSFILHVTTVLLFDVLRSDKNREPANKWLPWK